MSASLSVTLIHLIDTPLASASFLITLIDTDQLHHPSRYAAPLLYILLILIPYVTVWFSPGNESRIIIIRSAGPGPALMQLSTVPYIMLLLVYPKMRWPLITPQSDTTDTTHSLAIANFQLFPVSVFQLFPVSAFQPLLVLVVKHVVPLPYIIKY